MNMGYISDTARNQTHNLFHPKREPIQLGHSDGLFLTRIPIKTYKMWAADQFLLREQTNAWKSYKSKK